MDMPKLTAEDRKEALRIALESRTKRADVRKKLSQGKLSAKQVIDMRDDEAIGRMRVSAFIEAMPGYGKAKTEKPK